MSQEQKTEQAQTKEVSESAPESIIVSENTDDVKPTEAQSIAEEIAHANTTAEIAETKADAAIEETAQSAVEIAKINEEIEQVEQWTQTIEKTISTLAANQAMMSEQLIQLTAQILSLAQTTPPSTQPTQLSEDGGDQQVQKGSQQKKTMETPPEIEPADKVEIKQQSRKSQREWH